MKKYAFLLIFCGICEIVAAQTSQKLSPEQLEVKAVIDQLFTGMKKGDSTLVRSVFYKKSVLQSAFIDKSGKSILSEEENVNEFIKAVGTPHKEIWDERLLSYDIKIDENLASAWTPYEFYLGDKFSHAGVDTYLLFKSEEGWKIINITDTRRKTPFKK